jgi:hypothetical protein
MVHSFLLKRVIVVLLGLFMGAVGAAAAGDPAFRVANDGKIELERKTFGSMAEYYRSVEFLTHGKRCGTKLGRLASMTSDLRVQEVADCSLMQTFIQQSYWPKRTYVIPIVFHVIHRTDGTGSIPDSRIYKQVQVLNEDYLALAGTLGELGFNVHIRFELAGITRTVHNGWFEDQQEVEYKSALGWDQRRFLNVYVNSASGYLGYSYFPQEATGSVYDGVVLLYSACGGRDQGDPPYDQGRTLTHEIGHYLGLLHTFEGGCGLGYTAGDLIVDTNPEKTEHFACEATASCGAPAPIHNYMNYTDDLCMQEFTPEQANRAVCSLLNYRSQAFHVYGGAAEGEMFVRQVAMDLDKTKEGGYRARSVVVVRDAQGVVVPDAIVSVRWGGVLQGGSFATTNSSGRAVLVSAAAEFPGTMTVTVTNVFKADQRYNPDHAITFARREGDGSLPKSSDQ